VVTTHPYEVPEVWSPNSPDFNPIEYKIWILIHQRFTRQKWDVNDLIQRLTDMRAGVEQSVIDDAIDQWRRRLSMPAFEPQEDILNIQCDTH